MQPEKVSPRQHAKHKLVPEEGLCQRYQVGENVNSNSAPNQYR